jgi:hypothetical protein
VVKFFVFIKNYSSESWLFSWVRAKIPEICSAVLKVDASSSGSSLTIAMSSNTGGKNK